MLAFIGLALRLCYGHDLKVMAPKQIHEVNTPLLFLS